MGGALGEKVDEIVANYNASQDEYHLTATYRGSYTETMTAAIAAFRAGEQPNLVQVFEVGTGTMMAAEGAVYPVYQLMEEHGQNFDPFRLPGGRGGLLHQHRRPDAVDALQLVDPDPVLQQGHLHRRRSGRRRGTEDLGRCRSLLAQDRRKRRGRVRLHLGLDLLGAAGKPVGSWHNQPIGTNENGFGSIDSQMTVNGPVQIRHWENLAKWEDEGLFKYGGPAGGADSAPAFYSGECAIYMNSSASRAGILANTDFRPGPGYAALLRRRRRRAAELRSSVAPPCGPWPVVRTRNTTVLPPS